MKLNQKGFSSPFIMILFLLILGTALVSGWLVYRSKHADELKGSGSSYSSKALMTVTSSGGMCAKECNHPVYNLYENGTFEGHTKVSKSEISTLKNTIETTDFSKYSPNPQPRCESFVDGFDQVLYFPQKYGNKSLTPCMLDISDNDPAFSYINKLIEAHYIQQN